MLEVTTSAGAVYRTGRSSPGASPSHDTCGHPASPRAGFAHDSGSDPVAGRGARHEHDPTIGIPADAIATCREGLDIDLNYSGANRSLQEDLAAPPDNPGSGFDGRGAAVRVSTSDSTATSAAISPAA